MKTRTGGFLLLSPTIYAAILTLIVASVVRLALVVMPVAYNLMHWSSYTPFYTAHDFVRREIAGAPREKNLFLKLDQYTLAWGVSNRFKELGMKEGALVYREGEYIDGKLTKVTTTVLVRDCTFTIDRNTEGLLTCRAQLDAHPEHAWECCQVAYV
jgi:hypothetical protein